MSVLPMRRPKAQASRVRRSSVAERRFWRHRVSVMVGQLSRGRTIDAKRNADQSSDEFKLAAADYKEAAETYRLAATVAAIAAGKLRIDDIACVALHDQLSRSLKDANIAIDKISAELVPASFLALADSANPMPLKSLAGRLLDPKLMDQARRAPMEAIERVSNDALAALGCGRGTG